MKNFLRSRDGASKGAALMIVLAFVVLLTGVALAYMTRTTTDRQLTQSSYNDTSADLLARSALDIIVSDFKQELLDPSSRTVTRSNIQPQNCGIPADRLAIPNLVRRSVRLDQPGQANAMPAPGAPSLASAVSSADVSANGRSITNARWNSHYLVPRAAPVPPRTWDTIYSDPVSSFVAPDWVLVTAQGSNPAPLPNAVIGRYAFAVYDEGGLLDMSVAGAPINHANYPPPDNQYGWANLLNCAAPSPTPWLVNVGRKGTVAFADLTALPAAPTTNLPQSQIDNIIGWRNYATTQQTGSSFGSFNYSGDTVCKDQDIYGSYLLYFGDPPFKIESMTNLLTSSSYPFTAVYPNTSSSGTRTDQALTTRQELLKMRGALGFSQNTLQYMGTFSRERNRPAPDWPGLNTDPDPNNRGILSEGRFNMNNLALLVPNPCDPSVSTCVPPNGKKKGWQTGKNRQHLLGTVPEIVELFGLFWVKAGVIPNNTNYKIPGHWTYVEHTGPNPPGDPDPDPNSIICFRGANQQEDFFQILHYALNVLRTEGGRRCPGPDRLPRTFAIGASLIDQYDSGADCITYLPANWAGTGCDLDPDVVNHNGNSKYATHTTVIRYGQGPGSSSYAFGMEPDYSSDHTNGDEPPSAGTNRPHRPCGGNGSDCAPPNEPPAPPPAANTQVISHAFSNVGEFGYGIDSSPDGVTSGLPTLDFNPPTFYDAPVLDFFSYNPISSAYPRAGIVNLYTRNAPVLAAILAGALKNDVGANPIPNPLPIISGTPAATSEAMQAAKAIVCETQWVLTATNPPGCSAPDAAWSVKQTDFTRAIAARLAARAARDVPSLATSDETKKSIARALAEVGQTRTWNLFIDVIAQTGKYKPNSADLSGSNFVVEGEKRYWLHIALGRDLKINLDGTQSNDVDVLGTQLEEVIE
jgi:hypothetical protein